MASSRFLYQGLLSALVMALLLHFGIGKPLNIKVQIPLTLLGKIVKGVPAKVGQHPYLVSIHYDRQAIPFCGGAILDERTIITASHCFDEHPPYCSQANAPNCYQIVAGEHDLFVNESHEQVLEFTSSPSTLIRHEDYDSFHYDNDIALIRLNEPLVFNKYVKPIALVDPEITYNRAGAKIAGWGKLSSNSNGNVNVLQTTNVDIFTDEKCFNQWGDDYHPEDMICAGGKPIAGSDLAPDACQGDSGGPLVAKGLEYPHEEYIVGIISWGWECGYPDYPGLYTKVENYIPWINENRLQS